MAKKFLIIGVGEFGMTIAKKLFDLKNDVMLVDADKEKVNLMKDDFDNVIQADCMQPQVLKELNVKDYDACVVTVGRNFQDSLEITYRLKEFGAKYVLSKSYSDIQSKFLKKAGADEIVYPEKDSAEKIAVTLNSENLIDFIEIGDKFGMFELEVRPEWIGKDLVQIDARKKYGINVICVRHNGNILIPSGDYKFSSGDVTFLFGEKDLVNKLIKVKKSKTGSKVTVISSKKK